MLSSCRPKERREMCIFADFREDCKVHLLYDLHVWAGVAMCRCDDVRLTLALTICCEERYGCRKIRTFSGLDVVPELPLVWQCRSKSTPM
jgi:hypothetical protein